MDGRKLERVDDLYNWIDSAYSYLAMVNYPYPANFMMPLPGNPIKEVCLRTCLQITYVVTYARAILSHMFVSFFLFSFFFPIL